MSPAMRARLLDARNMALPVGLLSGPLLVILAAKASPWVAAAVIVGAICGIAAITSPLSTLVLTAMVVPLERLGRFSNDADTVTFSLMRLMGLLGIATLAIHWFLTKRKLKFTKPFVVYLAYIIVSMLSLIGTSDQAKGIQQVTAMIGNAAFLLLITNVITRKEQVRLPIVFWLATTVAVGVFSLYEWHNPKAAVRVDRYDNSGLRTTDERFSTVMEDYGEFDAIGSVRRVLGPTSSPAVYGINIILTLPFYFWLWRTTKSTWVRLFCATGLAVGAYNVILTNTRAAVLTLVFTGVAIAWTRLVRIKFIGIVAAAVVAASMVPFLPSQLYDRVFRVENYTTERSATLRIRLIYWETAVNIFADHWLLGCGIGNQNELPMRLSNMAMPANSSVHNEYLESLIETGIVGYPLIVGFMVLLYRRCRAAELTFTARGDTSTALFLTAARVGFYSVLFYALQCDVLHFTLKGWWLSAGLCVPLADIARMQPPLQTNAPAAT
jgi:O-Antigen ligase